MFQTAAMTAAAFNLVCTGVQTTVEGGHTRQEGFARVYRMDLSRNRWCAEACTETLSFIEVTPETITFSRVNIPSPRVEAWLSVSRESGTLHGAMNGPNMTWAVTARCERAPFTGFPVQRF